MYGRCYVVGASLVEVVGWNALSELSAYYDEVGVPNVEAWMTSLPKPEQGAVNNLLTP
jgi:hypothetical protein